jgi:hypothetical protein
MVAGEEALVNRTTKPTLPHPKPPRVKYEAKPNVEPNVTGRRGSINSIKMEDYCREFISFGRQMKNQIKTGWNNNVTSTSSLTRDTFLSMINPSISATPTTEYPEVVIPPLPKQIMREKKDQDEEIKLERSQKEDMVKQSTIILADDKRNADFHQLFKSVPEDDQLVQDYNCAYYRDIMIQGRLYISQNYICFNSKFFKWVTNVRYRMYV